MKNDKKQIRVLTGNEACAEGALHAGIQFYAGYPITPSSEVAEVLSNELPKNGGVFIQMEDEIASIAAIIGASLTGAKTMTATSGPGFSLMQENLGYAVMAEVPCVIVNVMRGGPSTGLPTMSAQGDVMQARWGTHGDHPIIVLSPDSVQEAFTLTIKAFNLAEAYRSPVILLMDEIIGHLNEKMEIPDDKDIEIINRVRPKAKDYLPYAFTENDVPPMADFGSGYRFHVTGLAHDETGFPTNDHHEIKRLYDRLERKINHRSKELADFEEYMLDDAEIAVVAYGSVARSVRSAVKTLRQQGLSVGMLRLKTIWPFPENRLKELAGQVQTMLVPEMNYGQLVLEVERLANCSCRVLRLNKANGEPISPHEIIDKVTEAMA